MWEASTSRYPSLRDMVAGARMAESPGRWIQTDRLQRCWSQAAGDNWAMLPGAAGFVDPLHSTGIAHSIAGIARLVEVLERHWNKPELPTALQRYGQTVQREIRHVDRLVAGCYDALPSFARFVDFSLLYFVAAIRFESQCRDASDFEQLGAYLGADEPAFVALCDEALERVSDGQLSDAEFRNWIRRRIGPLQSAGLERDECRNMYHHTAAE